MHPKITMILKFGINVTFFIFITYIIVKKITYSSILSAFSALNLQLFYLAVVLFILRNFLAAERCQYLIFHFLNIHCKCIDIFSSYLVSIFYNLFIPTGVGGDVARAIFLFDKYNISKTGVSTIVIFERILGMTSIVCLSLVGLLFLTKNKNIIPWYSNLIFLFDLLWMGSIFFMLVSFNFRSIINKLFSKINFISQFKKIFCLDGLTKILTISFLYSLFYQIVGVWCVILLIKSQGVDFPWYYSFLIMPNVWILSLIPVIAVREGVIVYLYNAFGMPLNYAVTFSILYFVLSTIEALPGFLLRYGLFNKWRIKVINNA